MHYILIYDNIIDKDWMIPTYLTDIMEGIMKVKEIKKVLDRFTFFNFRDEELKFVKTSITNNNSNLYDCEIEIESTAFLDRGDGKSKLTDLSFVERLAYGLEVDSDLTMVGKTLRDNKISLGFIYTGR